MLETAGLRVVICERAHEGMGTSLAHGVKSSPAAAGWIVMLADMPFVRPASITAVAERVRTRGVITAPSYRGERGHPVGFPARYRAELEAVTGDEGARHLVRRDGIELFDCDDPGVVRDIDTPEQLPR